jgi:hypothetical protein
MSIRAQIELMTVPQEFTRLCNAVLVAEYGDDFLPIDDDRGDRGNDGFVKSERRMFAAHCFKRAQNQSVDALIRAKMVGDLGKAIALKNADVWPVDAWTFLTNYPVSEGLAAEVSEMGRKAHIDVSWRGPDFFANALAEHPKIAETFPALQITEVSDKLARIEEKLSSGPKEHPAADAYGGPPRNADEQRALLASRPPGWEYLLFAGVIRQRRDALEPKWRDQELHLPSRARNYLEWDEVPGFLSRAFKRLRATIEPLTPLFENQQDAFGAPGEPGDQVRIEHFANWVMDAYEDMLQWGAEMRAVESTDEFERAIQLAAKVTDQPLGEIRSFVDRLIVDTERIADFVALPIEEQEANPLVIKATLAVSVDTDLMNEAAAELSRAVDAYVG